MSKVEHSKAFENMVTGGDDDIVGLLAYALLKQNLREEAIQGNDINGAFRNPSPVTVNQFRGAAEQRLNQFAAIILDEARDEIQQSAVLSQLYTTEANLISRIQSATGAVRAILTNIAAWLITGAIVFILVVVIASNEVAGKFYDDVIARLSGRTMDDTTFQQIEKE